MDCINGSIIKINTALQVKYKEKYEKAKGHYVPVQDTPQILHAKAVRTLASEVSVIQKSQPFYFNPWEFCIV